MAFKPTPEDVWIIDPRMWNVADHYRANQENWWIAIRIKIREGASTVRGTRLCRMHSASVLPPWMFGAMNTIDLRCSGNIMHFAASKGGTPEFPSDEQAEQWVYDRAQQGSEFHERAVSALIKAKLAGD